MALVLWFTEFFFTDSYLCTGLCIRLHTLGSYLMIKHTLLFILKIAIEGKGCNSVCMQSELADTFLHHLLCLLPVIKVLLR